MGNLCRQFLKSMRATVPEVVRKEEEGSMVTGEGGRYTVHLKDGRHHDVQAHCKWCARVEVLQSSEAK